MWPFPFLFGGPSLPCPPRCGGCFRLGCFRLGCFRPAADFVWGFGFRSDFIWELARAQPCPGPAQVAGLLCLRWVSLGFWNRICILVPLLALALLSLAWCRVFGFRFVPAVAVVLCASHAAGLRLLVGVALAVLRSPRFGVRRIPGRRVSRGDHGPGTPVHPGRQRLHLGRGHRRPGPRAHLGRPRSAPGPRPGDVPAAPGRPSADQHIPCGPAARQPAGAGPPGVNHSRIARGFEPAGAGGAGGRGHHPAPQPAVRRAPGRHAGPRGAGRRPRGRARHGRRNGEPGADRLDPPRAPGLRCGPRWFAPAPWSSVRLACSATARPRTGRRRVTWTASSAFGTCLRGTSRSASRSARSSPPPVCRRASTWRSSWLPGGPPRR